MKRSSIVLLVLAFSVLFLATGCCSTPDYKPSYWNDGGTVQRSNNCYNYGNNKRTDTFAQPGRASGNNLSWPNDMNCNAVMKAAVADGLDPLPASGLCPKGKYSKTCKVALVVAPQWDYHWYRLDRNGMWSHKPGSTRATNLDNSYMPISDPQAANRGAYTDFCGYLCSCSSYEQGKGRENIN